MNKTFKSFALCCLALIASFSVFTTPAQAQRAPIEGVPYVLCPPAIHDQMIDVSAAMAEIEKQIIAKKTDESNDQGILSLSCFEEDYKKHMASAKKILAISSAGWGAIWDTILDTAVDTAISEAEKFAGKFACENIKKFIQAQLDQCWNFSFNKRKSSGGSKATKCLIDANASITINRSGFGFPTGVVAEGSISGLGLNESVLLGVDAVAGLESLYTNWTDPDVTYTSQTARCGDLDPSINTDYSSLGAGEIPANAIRNSAGTRLGQDEVLYTNVGTFTENGQVISYENKASCYGFKEKLAYVPCGYEADGVTPAACVNPTECCSGTADECVISNAQREADGQSTLPMCDTLCCNIETDDCTRSGLDAICPCSQGGLETFVGGECSVGVPTCCNGDENDCETHTDGNGNLLYPYCEGTEPEEEVLDCEVERDNIVNQLQLTDDQLIAECPEQFVAGIIQNMDTECRSFGEGNDSACWDTGFCKPYRKGGFSLDPTGACELKASQDDGFKKKIAEECRTLVSNQDVFDGADPEVLQTCDIDPADFGPYLSPEVEAVPDTNPIPTPTPTPTPNPTPTPTPTPGTLEWQCNDDKERCLVAFTGYPDLQAQCYVTYNQCMGNNITSKPSTGSSSSVQTAPTVPKATTTPSARTTPPASGTGSGSLIDNLF